MVAQHSPSHPNPNAQNAWPVYGHRWAVRNLARALAAPGGTRQAYLFLGPRQVGKSTLVRAFATALFCTGEAKPCGHCRSCTLMAHGSHSDYHTVAPMDGGDPPKIDRITGKLYQEQAENLVADAWLRPFEGAHKLFHIQDAQRATTDRFLNLLLKTVEEPPESTIICITALDRESVLPTIVSRCQVFDLQPLDHPTITQALVEGWNVPHEQAALLARLSAGRLGWAVEQAQRPAMWQERQTRLEQLWALLRADRNERLALSEQMAGRSTQLYAMLELWAVWWRDVMLVQAGGADACCNTDFRPELERQAQALRPEQVRDYIRTMRRVEQSLRTNVNARLALDVMLLRLPHLT